MSFAIRTNCGRVSLWDSQIWQEGSGFFRSLFSFAKNSGEPLKQPYPLDTIDSSTLKTIYQIVNKGYFPLLDSEEELTNLKEVLDFFQIEYDPLEIRILTGIEQWLPDEIKAGLSYRILDEGSSKEQLMVEHKSIPNLAICLLRESLEPHEIFISGLTPIDLEMKTNLWKKYGLEVRCYTTSTSYLRSQYLFNNLFSSFLPPDWREFKQKQFYSKLQPYFDLDGKRVFNFKGKIFFNIDPNFRLMFYGYFHTLIKNGRFDFSLGDKGEPKLSISPLSHVYFSTFSKEYGFPGFSLEEHFHYNLPMKGDPVRNFWQAIKKENSIVLTQDQRTKILPFFHRLDCLLDPSLKEQTNLYPLVSPRKEPNAKKVAISQMLDNLVWKYTSPKEPSSMNDLISKPKIDVSRRIEPLEEPAAAANETIVKGSMSALTGTSSKKSVKPQASFDPLTRRFMILDEPDANKTIVERPLKSFTGCYR